MHEFTCMIMAALYLDFDGFVWEFPPQKTIETSVLAENDSCNSAEICNCGAPLRHISETASRLWLQA